MATTDNSRKRSFLESYKTSDVAESLLRQQFQDTELVPTSYGTKDINVISTYSSM